jgi:hypothetical protein
MKNAELMRVSTDLDVQPDALLKAEQLNLKRQLYDARFRNSNVANASAA